MKKIGKEVLEDAAHRLLFEMTPQEYSVLESELGLLYEQLESIGGPELDGYEPMTFPFPCETDFLREDIPEASLSREDALRNASSKTETQIKVPKVVG